MFSGRSDERTIWNRIGWWVAEIAVVFIGVYLAFLLEGYRTEQRNEQKKQQIYTSLHNYLSAISPNLQRSAQQFDSAYAEPILEAYKDGKMPRLEPLPFLTLAIDESTWRAMLQSGAIDLLDVSFILQVNGFFATYELFGQETDHFNRMQDQYLLPNANANINTFYNTQTKRVKPLFRWYVEYLKLFPDELKTMKRQADNIIEDLEQKMNKQQLEKINVDSLENAKTDPIEQSKKDSLEKTNSQENVHVDSSR